MALPTLMEVIILRCLTSRLPILPGDFHREPALGAQGRGRWQAWALSLAQQHVGWGEACTG